MTTPPFPIWLPRAGWITLQFSTEAHYHPCQLDVSWRDRENGVSTHSIVLNDNSWRACFARAWECYNTGQIGATGEQQ